MIKLILEKGGKYYPYGEYNSPEEANQAIINYCKVKNFHSYYWNCYVMPEGSEFGGGTHIDFGSWSEFFIMI